MPGTPAAKRALIAAALGWMLDAMDVLLYSFVLDEVRREFGIDDRMSGVLLALAACGLGDWWNLVRPPR